jgi:hypothetical protein
MILKLSRFFALTLGLGAVAVAALAQPPDGEVRSRPVPRGRFDEASVVRSTEVVGSSGPYAVPPPVTVPGPEAMGLGRFGVRHVVGAAWPVSPEEAAIAQQAEQAAHRVSEAKSDSDRDKAKSDLRELLEKQFDLRQQRHEKEITALETQVKKLKDLVRKRTDNRREIVSKRLDQVLNDAEGLGW